MFAMGQKLCLLRLQKGITQGELSRRSRIPQSNISNIEKGKQDLTISTLLKLCSALEVKPADVFKEDLPPQRLPFTRVSVERMAKAIVEGSWERLSPSEEEIARLFADLLPQPRRRALPAREIHHAWYELRKKLADEEIRILLERIHDEEARQEAKAQKDYERLAASLKGLEGKRAR